MALGSLYRPFLELAREAGVAIDVELARFGLTLAEAIDDGARLSPDQGRALVSSLMRALPKSAKRTPFGLQAAERFLIEDADLIGYIIRHCPHALAAANALVEHGRLIGDTAAVRVTESGSRITLTLGLAGSKRPLAEGADFALAIIRGLLRDCSAGRTLPLEVRLPHRTPRDASAYRRFFGATLRFDVEVSALVYDRAAMLAPFEQSDRRLLQILEQRARDVAARLAPSNVLRDRVRSEVAHGLSDGRCDLKQVALRCGLSERTLRRRLDEAGTSFRRLVDEVRQERAQQLLSELDSVSAVAHALGFADSTAFTRAFRRWTGDRPQAYLQRLRAG